MSLIDIHKLHACGNSCIVVIDPDHKFLPDSGLIEHLLDNNRGIGADNLMIIRGCTAGVRQISGFNRDGSRVGMCANGLRCCGLLLKEFGLVDSTENSVSVSLDGRQTTLRYPDDGIVAVGVGRVSFNPSDIPFLASAELLDGYLPGFELDYRASVLSVGNPHCVIQVPDLNQVPLDVVGHQIENLACFPERCNVEFVQVLDAATIKVLFWERGVGVTQSSGSGSCAAAAASFRLGLVVQNVQVNCQGGTLQVSIEPETMQVEVSGRPVHIFSVQIDTAAF